MSVASYDVIVVGAGNAALSAALSAREQGANVLVLERAPQEHRGGNSIYSDGSFRMVYSGLEDIQQFVPDLTPEELANTDFGEYSAEHFLDDLARLTEYRTDPDLAEILVRRSTDTVQWIRQKGVRFVPKYGMTAYKHEGRFKFFAGAPVHAAGGGPELVNAEIKAAEKQGIPIRYRSRATSLLRDRTGIAGVGVTVDGVEEIIHARAVVLASGGFSANREWRTRYLGPGWDLAKVRGCRYNTGDGIEMALKVGAQPYGNWSGAHAVQWEMNAPEYAELSMGDGYTRHSYPFGIMINALGLRYLDEGADLRNYTYAKYGRVTLAQPGQFAWQIFDSKVHSILRSSYSTRQATKVTANSLEELVRKLEGVDQKQALKTINEFNAAVKQDVPFNPNIRDGRCTVGLPIPKSNWATTIDTPPFEAYHVTCGITFTFGGLKITTQAQVVDIEDQPIPGLYAAGELVGGLFYFNYPGSSGLTSGAVFGRIAGESAAHHARKLTK